MSSEPRGLDETRHSLIEHLSELRSRLVKSLLAVAITTSGALYFAPDLLNYVVRPLTQVMRDRNRVETLLVDGDKESGSALAARLAEHPLVRFVGRFEELSAVRDAVDAQIAAKRPIDLVLVSASSIGEDGTLVSDLLENVEPVPEVVYLVRSPSDPAVAELQLEGASLIPANPRQAALSRVIRRAAAAAGKASQGEKLVVLSPLDPFFAYMKIALVIGLFLACPIWLFQAWQFVAPGLYANEKMLILPVIVSASALFVGGGLFAYFVMFPMMFDVLVNDMMPASLVGTFTIDKYLGLLMTMTLAFGLIFETPLFIALLAAVGVVTPALLRRFRRIAIVASFAVSALVTPTTDPVSLLLMAVPMCLFYEIGIILASVIHRRRAEKFAPVEASEPG